MTRSKQALARSPLAVTLLLLLGESPMHPYQMHRILRERRKDDVLDVRPATIYRLIERLLDAGLIEPVGTTREGRRPERTEYRLTDDGSASSGEWLRDLLNTPVREYPVFPAALSLAGILPPDVLATELWRRVVVLEGEVARIDAELRTVGDLVARIHLVEMEHVRAMLHAEVAWLRAIVADIRDGRLAWTPAELVAMDAERRERLREADPNSGDPTAE